MNILPNILWHCGLVQSTWIHSDTWYMQLMQLLIEWIQSWICTMIWTEGMLWWQSTFTASWFHPTLVCQTHLDDFLIQRLILKVALITSLRFPEKHISACQVVHIVQGMPFLFTLLNLCLAFLLSPTSEDWAVRKTQKLVTAIVTGQSEKCQNGKMPSKISSVSFGMVQKLQNALCTVQFAYAWISQEESQPWLNFQNDSRQTSMRPLQPLALLAETLPTSISSEKMFRRVFPSHLKFTNDRFDDVSCAKSRLKLAPSSYWKDKTQVPKKHALIFPFLIFFNLQIKSSKTEVSICQSKNKKCKTLIHQTTPKSIFGFPQSWRVGRLWLRLSFPSVSMTEPSTLILSVVLCALIILMTSIQSACSTVWFLRDLCGESLNFLVATINEKNAASSTKAKVHMFKGCHGLDYVRLVNLHDLS